MRSLYLALVGCCLCGSAQAFDSFTGGTVAFTYVASQVTSAPFDNKLILDSRDDAASFVASQGDVRGARLEAALRWLREQQPERVASDLELAEVILVQ
ncbi:MAG TPA: Holliday junction resolvase [Pseudomonas sp.]|nr:Holliday junction resolvase [Pseudomonas sp.]